MNFTWFGISRFYIHDRIAYFFHHEEKYKKFTRDENKEPLFFSLLDAKIALTIKKSLLKMLLKHESILRYHTRTLKPSLYFSSSLFSLRKKRINSSQKTTSNLVQLA